MATYRKYQLSSQPNGLPKDVSTLSQHVIHSVPATGVTDELWLYATNTSATQAAIVIEVTYNSVTSTLCALYIPPTSNILICPGVIFTSSTTSTVDIKITDALGVGTPGIYGYVNRITQ